MTFTIFSSIKKNSSKSKDKNTRKDDTSLKKKNKHNLFNVPYPCTRNIVIDLFHSQPNRSHSKSQGKSASKDHNKSIKPEVNKSSKKNLKSVTSEDKINATLEKLSRFQIYNDYKDKF